MTQPTQPTTPGAAIGPLAEPAYPEPLPDALLTRAAGGTSLEDILDAGLITQEQYDWLTDHPATTGGC